MTTTGFIKRGFIKTADRDAGLIGKTFCRLTVKSVAQQKGRRRYVDCLCECGSKLVVRVDCLLSGHSRSCGCLHREIVRQNSTTHGKTNSREHAIWIAMRQRCTNPKNDRFGYYGARGIRVCERWESFEAFLEDMGQCPGGHSIERSDNNGNYDPNNCHWGTRKEQMRNTRTNRLITFRSRTQCVAEWAEQLGISHTALRARLRNGWSISRALLTPVQKRRSA